MSGVVRTAGQILAFLMFAMVVGYFSAAPVYTHLSADKGLIKLNFSHAGQPKQQCRRLSQEELDQLPPNMRKLEDCPRERVPLLVEFELNDVLVYREAVAPSGLAGDGAATVYQKFPVAGGPQKFKVSMRDSRRQTGFDHVMERDLEIIPGRIVVIDFEAETGGFKIL